MSHEDIFNDSRVLVQMDWFNEFRNTTKTYTFITTEVGVDVVVTDYPQLDTTSYEIKEERYCEIAPTLRSKLGDLVENDSDFKSNGIRSILFIDEKSICICDTKSFSLNPTAFVFDSKEGALYRGFMVMNSSTYYTIKPEDLKRLQKKVDDVIWDFMEDEKNLLRHEVYKLRLIVDNWESKFNDRLWKLKDKVTDCPRLCHNYYLLTYKLRTELIDLVEMRKPLSKISQAFINVDV